MPCRWFAEGLLLNVAPLLEMEKADPGRLLLLLLLLRKPLAGR